MKTIIAIAAIIAVCNASFIVGTADKIAEINSMQSSWVAEENKFSGMSAAEIKRHYLGTILPEEPIEQRPDPMYEVLKDYITLPDSFDARTQWPGKIHAIRNQERCGSCWAFSSSEVLSDRYSISTNGATDVVLSPQDMISCDKTDMGCKGGYLTKAWTFLEETGIVPDACYPYSSGSGTNGNCYSQCTGTAGTWTKYHSTFYNTFPGSFGDYSALKQELYTNGPVQTGFVVYDDFMQYKSGVYVHQQTATSKKLGGHAVKIIGWGNEGGQDYWLVANSWGPTWGDQGYFKFGFSQTCCSFEASAIAGKAGTPPSRVN